MTEVKHPEITVEIIGKNSNAFNILGICLNAMKQAKLPQSEINEFQREATSADYNHLLATVTSWFNIQ